MDSGPSNMARFSLAITMTTYSVISTIIWLKNSKIPIGPSRIWSQGFKPSWEMVIYNGWGKKNNNLSDFMTNVLIANSFQVGLSFLYLFYNNILTRQLLADEWVRFVQVEGKKPLRVSAPVGMQRSSYSLTLPFKYSIPLMVASILMHWLISQSIFLVQTSAYDPGPNGGHNPAFDVSARGYSILGTILAISTGFVLVLVIIVHAWVRKYQGMPSGFQRMATDSAAISLMCLRPEGDTEAHLFPVRIGAVADQGAGSKMKRIAFSTDIDMEKPEDNGQYLLPQLIPKPKGSWGVRVGRLFGNGKGSTQ